MKTILSSLKPLILGIAVFAAFGLAAGVKAGPAPPPPDAGQFTRASSSSVRGAVVYSIRFPGGTASDFFKFLRSNGFTNDTILIAGGAGEIYVPDFTIKNVRLKEIAKSVEFVAEGKLTVEVVEEGEASDVNIWRIKLAEAPNPIRTKACPVPHLLGSPNGVARLQNLAEEVSQALIKEATQFSPDPKRLTRGQIHILAEQKIVVVIGADAYVEALSSALAAAENAATPERANGR
jgi:hypothetical protein